MQNGVRAKHNHAHHFLSKQLIMVPGICMSPIYPLKDGTSAISAASSRQLLMHADFRKTLNSE